MYLFKTPIRKFLWFDITPRKDLYAELNECYTRINSLFKETYKLKQDIESSKNETAELKEYIGRLEREIDLLISAQPECDSDGCPDCGVDCQYDYDGDGIGDCHVDENYNAIEDAEEPCAVDNGCSMEGCPDCGIDDICAVDDIIEEEHCEFDSNNNGIEDGSASCSLDGCPDCGIDCQYDYNGDGEGDCWIDEIMFNIVYQCPPHNHHNRV